MPLQQSCSTKQVFENIPFSCHPVRHGPGVQVRRIPHYRIKPRLLAQWLTVPVEEDFGELQFPVEEAPLASDGVSLL